MSRFGFCSGSYQLRNVNADCQTCQNFYPEAIESGTGASAVELSPTWGLAHFADLGGPSVRGSLYHDGRLFVAADMFYEVFADGTQVPHGFLPSMDPLGTEPVTMVANNANQLLICAAGQLWLFPLASGAIIYSDQTVGISQITITDPGGASLNYAFTPAGAVPAWTSGTSLTITGVTNLPFLNSQTPAFISLDGSGNIVVELPRTLSQGFHANISAINVVAVSTTGASSQQAPSSASQVASGSHVSWLNPTGIIGTASPAQAAIPNQSAQTYVDVLVGQNCGFAIPSGAIIDGIAVSFQLQTDATNFINGNVGAQLVKAGTATGNLPNETIPYSSSYQTINFGSATDLWGASWTPADINNGGFGLGVHIAGQYQGSAVNLVTNGDFENGTGPATGWTTMRDGAQWGFSGQFYTGARSYGVLPTTATVTAPAIQFDTTVPVTAGDVLLLSGAILNTSLATQGSILLQFYNGATFVSQQGISNTTTTLAQFLFEQKIITVPAGANQMQVVLANDNKTSSCYYDDVQVVHVHVANLQNYQITVYYHDVTYNATVTFTAPVSPFQTAGQPLTFANLTHVPQLNGNTYALASYSGNTATVNNVPATGTYNGSETGTVTGDIANYAAYADTGTVSGNVVSYNTDPVQVATTLGPFSWVGFLDGYFLALLEQDAQTTQGKTMEFSALEDGTQWEDTDTTGQAGYFRVLPFTDSVVGAIVNQRNIWLYGPKQTIVYYDSGASDPTNQFAPISGAFLEYGLAAEWSLAKLDNSVFWIGADERGWAMAFRSNGWSEQRVSNHAVEQAWNDYADVSDAQAYSIQADGHQFYHVWFPTPNKSWRYDAATGMWHEICWFDGSDNVAHRSRNHVFAFNKHLLGDPNSGTLYQTDPTFLTDDVVDSPQSPIRRVRRAPHVSNEMEWEFHHRLRINMETGLGPVNEIATVATGPPYLFAQDVNGNNWQVQINDNGTTTSTSLGPATAPAPMLFVDLVGLPYNITVYTLGVDTSGNLLLIPAPGVYTGYYTRLAMMTLPSALQTYISVQNGAILIDPPIAATREPQVMLRWSDDGGHTWSNEYAVGAGMAGNFRRRVEWRRLGRSRDRVYEMVVTDPIPWRVVDAYLYTTPSNQQPTERLAQRMAKMA